MAESAESRELSLVSKLELRIGLADSDTKFQSILQTFLTPLLLKLASENVSVRNKVVALCQHINTRTQSPSIILPVSALLKQFKEVKSPLVRHFDLIYIKQGLDRIDPANRLDLLPSLLHKISQLDGTASQNSIIFNLVLRLLPVLKLPPKGSPEDLKLREKLDILPEDATYLSSWFEKLLLLTPAAKNAETCHALSVAEYKFLSREAPFEETWNSTTPGGLSLVDTKVAALQFIGSGAFADPDRFVPALIATADPNKRLSDVADDILKRFRPDLESFQVVDRLFSLYLGSNEPGGAPAARAALKIKIISFLGKSVTATAESDRIIKVLDDGLISTGAGSARGLEIIKLRQQIFSFVTWLTRMGSPSDLHRIAPSVIKALRNMVEDQGWPVPHQRISSAELNSRSLAYESIGLLAPKVAGPSQMENSNSFDTGLLEWMFTSLASDSSGDQIFVSIEQALGSLLNSISKNVDIDLQNRLRPILIRFMNSQSGTRDSHSGSMVVRSTQFAAVRFANRCLPYSDVQGRCIDLLAIAMDTGEALEIVEEGRKGLDPYWYRMLNPQDNMLAAQSESEKNQYKFPRFRELITYLSGEELSSDDELQSNLFPAIFLYPHASVYPAAITFLRNILLCEALVSTVTDSDIEHNWEQRLDTIISNDENARVSLRQCLKQCDDGSVSTFLGACLNGIIHSPGKNLGRSAIYFIEIGALASNTLLGSLTGRASQLIKSVLSSTPPNQDTAAQAFGMLVSHPNVSPAERQGFWDIVAPKATSWKGTVGLAAYEARGAILAQAYLLSRLSLRNESISDQESKIQQHLETLIEILESSRDATLRNAAYIAIGQLSLAFAITPESVSNGKNWKIIIDAMTTDAKKHNEISITALGRLSVIIPKDDDESSPFRQSLKLLYDLHEVRVPEVQFAVGEALSVVAVGWESKSLITAIDVDVEKPQSNVSSHTLSEILEKVIADCKAPKPSKRKASVVWLLCLIQYSGQSQEVQSRLRQCQSTFVWLLSDRDDVVQESASRGLSLVYELGTQDLKDDLVRDLVRSFTTDNSNIGGGKVTGDTELFEPGALPTGDGSVTTYKDIVGLASEVGDPSLVYRFMSMASNSAIWSSRAAFGRFGLSNVLSDSNINGYLAQNPKLYPKLFRYKFDPNPNVQRSMNDIWNSLVKDSNAVIDSHFDAIMEDLLKSVMDGKQWRVRQASCAAIADLLQGRPVEKYDKYLGEILTKTFKALDDIKQTVREAAFALCKVLSDLVLRALETGDPNSRRAKLMLRHIVPFLLGQEGLESGVEEVQAYSIVTVTNFIKKSPSPLIRPFIPQILETFLTAMSSIEPQTVNYIHLNAEKYGLSGQDIDKMRLSSIRSSPMMEAIELHLLDAIDEQSMKDVASKLEGSLRSSIGLPSKVGCSRVLVILSSKSILFRPYATRFIKLLKKYVLDRNETVSASYSSAIGYLTRLATNEDVLDTVAFTKSLYLNAEDTQHRVVAGEILNSMSKLANDRVQAVAASFLPFVFLGMHDTTDEVREFFDKTWNDNVNSTRVIFLYLKEILDLVSSNLDSPRWAIKHASALTVAKAVMSMDKEIDISIACSIWPNLEKALSGKTWNGKEKVLEAFVNFSVRAKSFLKEEEQVKNQMKVIALREAKRNNVDYRPHGLKYLGRFAKSQEMLDVMPETIQLVTPIIDELVEDSRDKMDIEGKDNRISNLEEKTYTAAVDCLFHCLNPSIPSSDAMSGYMLQITPLIEKALINGGRTVYPVIFEGQKMLFDRFSEQHTASVNTLTTAFTSLTNTLLFRDLELPIESARNKRAQAALSFATMYQKSSTTLSDHQQSRVKEWLASERSEQIQKILKQVLEKI